MFFRCARTIAVAAFLVAAACAPTPSAGTEEHAVGQDGWLKGTTDERLDVVAGQLRGFDIAMVEVGYRFTELYFAGEERNWAYAKYHAEKIETVYHVSCERKG